MLLPGSRSQPNLDYTFDFSGTITTGGTAQLVLNQHPRRSFLLFQNLSTTNLVVGLGPATATATLSSGTIASISVGNSGMSYTVAPLVRILGGVIAGDLGTAPQHPAVATATLSGGSVNTITISDPGVGYLVAPYILLDNPMPTLGGGAYTPSATAGIVIAPNGSLIFEDTFVPTDALAVFGATTGQAFTCKVAF